MSSSRYALSCAPCLSLCLLPYHFSFCFLKQTETTRSEKLLGTLLLLSTDFTEHVRMDIQTDIGHVVNVLAGNQPDDLADLAFGKMGRQASERVGVNLFVLCQFRHVVQCRALCIGKERARPVLVQGIEFGLVHGGFDGK